jgi:RNA recognition motif-containing protein
MKRRFGFVDFANAESVQKALGDSSAIQDVLGDGARVEAISNSPAPRRDSSPREGGRFGGGFGGGDRSERGESRFGNSRRGERTSAVVEPSESTSLYLGNLPFDLDAAALEEALTEHAPEGVTINAIRMPGVQRSQYGEEESSSSFSDTRKNKGFAFVEMSNVEDAKKLLETLKQAVQEGYQWPMEQREDSFPLIKYAASTGPKTRDDFSNNRERRSNNSYGQRDNFSRGDRQQRRY